MDMFPFKDDDAVNHESDEESFEFGKTFDRSLDWDNEQIEAKRKKQKDKDSLGLLE